MYLSKYTALCIQDLVFSLKTIVNILRFYAQFFIGFQTCCVHPYRVFWMCVSFSQCLSDTQFLSYRYITANSHVLDRYNLILGSNINYPAYKEFATLEWMGPQQGATYGVHEGTVYCIMSVEETGVYKMTAFSITIFRLFKFN
jgi:hypothetical protein